MRRSVLTVALLSIAFACAAPEQVPPVSVTVISAEDSLLRMGDMSVDPGDSIRFALQAVPDSRLARFLVDGGRIEPLPTESGGRPGDPTALLYSVANEGGCVEDTHHICYHDYLLAVRSDWGDVRPLVFEIGQIGEVAEFRWLASQASDKGSYHLRLVLRNWSDDVLRRNPALALRQDTVDIAFDQDSLWILRSTLRQ